MKRIFTGIIFAIIFFHSTTVSSYAEGTNINRGEAFIFFGNHYKNSLPESYQFIDLKYNNVSETSELWDALQILVYLNKIKNVQTDLHQNRSMDVYTFEKLAEKIINIKLSNDFTDAEKKKQFISHEDLISISKILEKTPSTGEKISIQVQAPVQAPSGSLGNKEDVLVDVYNTLSERHYNHDSFEEDQLIDWAIKWLTEGTNDKYTTYFPPVESDGYFSALDGEYEGIWAYVDMPEPGIVMIITPIVGSPAESAGIQWGDVISRIDDFEILPETSLNEAVSKIKWPAGSKVELTVIREGEAEPIIITVTRWKIILKDIEHKKINNTAYYIRIKNFWENVDSDFAEALETLQAEGNIQKIIIDLRNNPGGYLDEVSNLLSHFIEKWLPTAIVDTGKNESQYKSKGYNTLDLDDYEVILLQNKGTASASEIMIGTLKDYYPNITVIGEQSFGKGSVQSLKTYYDGSTLKYTSAKWFTGKTKLGIDGIGITPDIFLEFDLEKFDTQEIDNQLKKALEQ